LTQSLQLVSVKLELGMDIAVFHAQVDRSGVMFQAHVNALTINIGTIISVFRARSDRFGIPIPTVVNAIMDSFGS